MKIHDIKIHPEYFEAVKDGRKTCEVRQNDRNYQIGDILYLRRYGEVSNGNFDYLDGIIKAKITYIITYLQSTNVLVLSIKVIE
jgi:ASC-1-like (ASCH) protein